MAFRTLKMMMRQTGQCTHGGNFGLNQAIAGQVKVKFLYELLIMEE